MLVKDVMQTKIRSVPPSATIGHVLDLMVKYDIRHVPVVEDGTLVGFVSDRDIRSRLGHVSCESEMDEQCNREIGSLMTTHAETVKASSKVAAAIDLMLELKLGTLPVLDDATGKLCGVLSYEDILRAVRSTL